MDAVTFEVRRLCRRGWWTGGRYWQRQRLLGRCGWVVGRNPVALAYRSSCQPRSSKNQFNSANISTTARHLAIHIDQLNSGITITSLRHNTSIIIYLIISSNYRILSGICQASDCHVAQPLAYCSEYSKTAQRLRENRTGISTTDPARGRTDLPVLNLSRSDGFHVVQWEDGLGQMKSSALVLARLQNIGLRTDGAWQRHDNPLPERIDRWIRNLSKKRGRKSISYWVHQFQFDVCVLFWTFIASKFGIFDDCNADDPNSSRANGFIESNWVRIFFFFLSFWQQLLSYLEQFTRNASGFQRKESVRN